MMPGQRIALASASRVRTVHHIHLGPVMLQKIQIHRGEVFQLVAKVADGRYCLQKNLGHNHSRTQIDIRPAAVHLLHHGAKQTKVLMGCRPNRRSGRCWVRVRSIRANRHMHCHWNIGTVGA